MAAIQLTIQLNKIFNYLILLVFLIMSNQGFSQERFRCGSDLIHDQLMNKDKEYFEKYNNINDAIYNMAKEKMRTGNKERGLLPNYVIPVVIHIITPPGTPIGTGNNLTDAQIEEGLEYLNDAFGNKDDFQSANGVDVGISFCLAKRDPNGLPTNGITRTSSTLVADVSPCSPFGTNMDNDAAIKALVNWDCSQYLNIWLVTDLYNDNFGCSLAGFAYFPGAPCSIDGVVQESRYWITKDGTTVSTHEVGHYFSLNHTFSGGCSNANCLLDGDKVCDTPPDGSPSFAPCNTNSCNTDSPDLQDDNTNYMDYTSCKPPHFTSGQKDRMISGLEAGRASLISSQGCIPVINLDVALLNLNINSSGCGTSLCPDIKIKNTGSSTITYMEILIKVDGSNVVTYPWVGNLLPNSTILINIPCFNSPLGNHIIVAEVINLNSGIDGYPNNNIITINNFIINAKPELSLVSYESSHCGKNGNIIVKTDFGKEPYLYTINGLPLSKQLSPAFYDLSNQLYNIIVEDKNGCSDTLIFDLPDICPPCISGIINKYAAIYSFCDTATLMVDDATGFAPDDKVLIYQAKGAIIDSTNTANFGNILNYGNAGNYEYNQIAKIEGNKITLKYQRVKSYDIPGKPQLINIPDLGNATVCNLTSAPWDGSKGGVLIFEADSVILAGNIDVSAKGFRGGIAMNAETYNPPFDSYFSSSYINGAAKGEGIDILKNAVYTYAKGKRANGGGGGNDHNAGGAGGGNYGQGGMGGMGLQPTYYPGIQGISGLGLDYNTYPDKIFFGGGGGAGHSNINYCGKGTSGGNGGGIAILNVKTVISNTNKILASGENALSPGINNGCDGAGGGGAGGVIIYNSIDLVSNLGMQANGGNGGDVYDQLQYQLGPGGGGGGGLILTTLALPPIVTLFQVFGGTNGILNQFDPYGATPGEAGNIKGNTLLTVASSPYIPFGNINFNIDTFCFSNGFLGINITNGTEIPEFKLDEGNWQKSGYFQGVKNGQHLISIRTKCNQLDTVLNINFPEQLKDSLIYLTAVNCKYSGSISVIGVGGLPPYLYKINNGASQVNGEFNNLMPGNYIISIIDNKGCQIDKTYEINDLSKQLSLITDSLNILLDCIDTSAFISVHATGTYPFYYYSLNNGPTQNNGLFDSLKVGSYSIIAYDDYGCLSQKLDFNVTKSGSGSITVNNVELCAGQSVNVGNHTYSISGSYFDTLKTMESCDSIIHTNLLIHPNYYINNTVEICIGDSLKVGNSIYKTTGNYVDKLQTIYGCDSFFNTFLTVVPFKSKSQTFKLCEPESIKVGNNVYSSSGTYIDTLKSIGGCDSIITSNIVVSKTSEANIQTSFCEGDSVIINSKTYFKEGSYTDKLKNYNGCDSIINININVISTFVTSQEYNICLGDSIHGGNNIYTKPGIYADTLKSYTGCDSILISNIVKIDDSICDSINCRLYIPNVFSPNADGINDYFEIFTPVSTISEMAIYDRWGELVITIKGPDPKWNGKTSNGKKMHQGVYIYLVKGTCENGLEFQKYGDITLIR